MKKGNLALALAVTIAFSILVVPTLVPTIKVAAVSDNRHLLKTTADYVDKMLGYNRPLLTTNSIFMDNELSSMGSYKASRNQIEIPSTFIETETTGLIINETINEMTSKETGTSDDAEIPEELVSDLPDMNGTEGINSETGLVLYGQAVGVSSYDPSRPPAELLDVAKEGHWFPNKDYSRICYEIVPWPPYTMQFYIHIDRIQDQYARTLRAFLDSTKILDTVVYNGFDGYVNVNPSAGSHKIILEIQWGYYSDYGWKLISFEPTSNGGITGEFFPKESYSKLRWNVYMGPDTKVDIKVDQAGDTYSRTLRIYVDGTLKVTNNAPLSFKTFSLGDYAKHSLHEITVEIQWGYYMDWGWKLNLYRSTDRFPIPDQFNVHYAGVYYEIDYMTGYKPQDDVLQYIVRYYINHGYERPVFLVDQEVQLRNTLSYDEYYAYYYNVYFDHRSQAGVWKYILYGCYDEFGSEGAYGWADIGNWNAIFIADGRGHYRASLWFEYWFGGVTTFQTESLTMMHEIGHSIHIVDLDANGEEVYCEEAVGGNSFCVMAHVSWDNLDNNPYYCTHHWSQRVYP